LEQSNHRPFQNSRRREADGIRKDIEDRNQDNYPSLTRPHPHPKALKFQTRGGTLHCAALTRGNSRLQKHERAQSPLVEGKPRMQQGFGERIDLLLQKSVRAASRLATENNKEEREKGTQQ